MDLVRKSALTLLLLFCLGQLVDVSAQQQQYTNPNAVKIYVKNMHCESCAKKIRSRIFTVQGVHRVVTWVKQDLALVEPVEGQTLSVKSLWETLDEAKFAVDRVETSSGVITEKPAE